MSEEITDSEQEKINILLEVAESLGDKHLALLEDHFDDWILVFHEIAEEYSKRHGEHSSKGQGEARPFDARVNDN